MAAGYVRVSFTAGGRGPVAGGSPSKGWMSWRTGSTEAEQELRARCQIVHLEHDGETVIVDLVTLSPTRYAGEDLAAGTPMAMKFVAARTDEMHELGMALGRWERECRCWTSPWIGWSPVSATRSRPTRSSSS